MRHRWTQAELDYLREHYPSMMCRELTESLNAEFGLELTPGQVRNALKNHGIRSGRGAGTIPGQRPRIVTKQQAEWIRKTYVDISAAQLTRAFNERFGTSLTLQQIKSFVHNHGINSGRTGCFEKGGEPWNKGKKGWKAGGRSKETRFKRGHKPQTWVPVGTEVTDRDGYRKVKVSDDPDVESRFNWQFVHRAVWEKHRGPIPKGHAIVFVDGDKSNCDIDNLVMLNRAELVRFNQSFASMDLAPDPDLRRTAITAARLKQAAFDRRPS